MIIQKTILETMQPNGMYRNIASILNSTKLGKLSRLLNKYKKEERIHTRERERHRVCVCVCERKKERTDRQIAKKLNIIFLKITSVKIPL